MKSFAYADDLSKKTIALASKKDPNNVKAYMELLKAWRDMGGAQDYVVAKCHTITRSLPGGRVRLRCSCPALSLWPRRFAPDAARRCETPTVTRFGRITDL